MYRSFVLPPPWNLSQNFDNNTECPFFYSASVFEFFRRFLQEHRRRVKLCVEYLYHRHSFIQWHTIAPAFCNCVCLSVYSLFLTMKLSQLMLFCSSSSFSNDSFIINASLVGAWLATMDSCRRRILSREGVRKQGCILHLILPFSPIICLFVHHLLSCIPFH